MPRSSEEHVQLTSLITTRDQPVKLRVSLLGKVHGLFVRHGLKIRREVLTSQAECTRQVAGHDGSSRERTELAVIDDQLQRLHRNITRLEKECAAFANTLPGYDNLLSIGIGPLAVAVLLTHLSAIDDFQNTGTLPPTAASFRGSASQTKRAPAGTSPSGATNWPAPRSGHAP